MHKVINKKMEFRRELNENIDMLKKVELAQIEAEKSRHLKTKQKDDKKADKKDKLLKKRKHKDKE